MPEDLTDSTGLYYMANSTCVWTIELPEPGQTVVLTPHVLDTEDGYDTVTVYDGVDSSGAVLARWSGRSAVPPNPVVSTGRRMHVIFKSDEGV